MSLQVPIAVAYEFDVRASCDEVYAVLSDVPTSAGFFPGVERVVPLGRGVYRWDMEGVGLRELELRTVYAARYVSSKARGTVVWTPVPGIGNAEVGGSWRIVRGKASTALRLDIDATVHTPFAPLLRLAVEPVLRVEFETRVEHYIDNLIARFGGEA
jgi:hypothetical protein